MVCNLRYTAVTEVFAIVTQLRLLQQNIFNKIRGWFRRRNRRSISGVAGNSRYICPMSRKFEMSSKSYPKSLTFSESPARLQFLSVLCGPLPLTSSPSRRAGWTRPTRLGCRVPQQNRKPNVSMFSAKEQKHHITQKTALRPDKTSK